MKKSFKLTVTKEFSLDDIRTTSHPILVEDLTDEQLVELLCEKYECEEDEIEKHIEIELSDFIDSEFLNEDFLNF